MIEQKREYTGLGLDLEERDKHVACHALALALAMIDEVLVKQRGKPDNLHHFFEGQQKSYAFCLPLLPLQDTTRLEVGV